MHSLPFKYFLCLSVLICQTQFCSRYFTIFFLSPDYPSMFCFVSLGLQRCRSHPGFANWLRRKKRFASPVCFLFLSLLMPFLLSPSFQWSVSGLCPHHLYQSCIAYLVNSTKCCLWIYSLRWLVCAWRGGPLSWRCFIPYDIRCWVVLFLFLLYGSPLVNRNWDLQALS